MRRLRVPLVPRWLRWGVVLLAAATIFYVSVLVSPGPQPRELLGPHWDTLFHVVGYAVFALVLAYATANWRDLPYRRAVAVLAVAIGYGVLIEIAQATVPYRQFSYGDMLANAAGASLAIGWLLLESRIRYRRIEGSIPAVSTRWRREE